MAENFGQLVANIAKDIHDDNDSPEVKRAIVAALKHLRSKTYIFTESFSSFTAVEGQERYRRGEEVPGDLLSIKHMRLKENEALTELHQETFPELRRLRSSNAVTSGFPVLYAWYAESVWLWPIPGEGYEIELSYMQDATRDENTGQSITTSSPDSAS